MNNRINVSKIFSLFLTSATFRLSLSLFFGMIINFFYIASNLSSAFLYRNIWSATLTVYHSLFLLIRFYLISAKRRCKTEVKMKNVCLRTGICLLFLDLAATVMMAYTIRSGRVTRYSGVVLLCFVIYTIYSLTVSIVGMKRHSDDNQPLHFAARNMTLAAALMSVFNLQYSLLATLGANSYIIDRIIALCGFGVFFVIILLAIRLVVKNLPQGSKI